MATARRTRNQERVFQCLKSLEQEISAQDLLIELRERDQIMGLATIYRALETLKLEGVVQVRTLASGQSFYSTMEEDCHHITCLQCGESLLLEHCPVQVFEQELNKSYKFKIYYHTLEFYGICNKCQTRQESTQETSVLACVCDTDSCVSCHPAKGQQIAAQPNVRLSNLLDC